MVATFNAPDPFRFITGGAASARAQQIAAANAARLAQQQAIINSYNYRTYAVNVNSSLSAQGLAFVGTAGIRDMMEDFLRKSGGAFSDAVGTVATFHNKAIRDRRDRFIRAHRQVGEEAIAETLKAYKNRPNQGASGYRQTARFSGGRLERALASPNNIDARPDALSFINPAFMDTQARQWYRLNFGAGPRAGELGRGPKPYAVKFFGETIGSVSLQGNKPGRGFELPPGWFGGLSNPTAPGAGRGQIFTPISEAAGTTVGEARAAFGSSALNAVRAVTIRRRIKNLSIPATGFLDRGIETIARALPRAHTVLLRNIIDDSIENGQVTRGPLGRAGVDFDDAILARNAAITSINSWRDRATTELVRISRGL